ncbi:MAG: PAS domain S-box protein [Candidatus Saccharibacteria bacterium]|nr:PAS domain S-box protein [Pseudorhodobacter sp.]
MGQSRTNEPQAAVDTTPADLRPRLPDASVPDIAAIVMSSTDAMFIATVDGTVLTWNPGAETLLGYAADTVIGKNLTDLFAPDQRDAVLTLCAAVAGGAAHYKDTVGRRNDGALVTVSASLAPIRNHVLQVSGLSVVLRDMTDRQREDAASDELQTQYRTVVDGSIQGIVTQQDGRIVYANPAAARLLGRDNPDDLIGWNSFDDVVAEPDLAPFRTRTAAALRGETVAPSAPWRVRRADGRTIWVTSTAHRTVWQGRGAVTSFYTDVTAAHTAEAALIASEARYRALTQASDTIVWRTTPAGDVVFADRMWNDLTGQTEERTLNWGWLDAVHPDDRDPTIAAWQESLQSRTIHKNQFRIRLENGDYRWFSIRAVPILNDDGSVREWMGANTDIHERKHAEETVRESESRLQMALQAAKAGTWEAVPNRAEFVASDLAQTLFGILPGRQVTITDALAALIPEDRQQFETEMHRAVQTGSAFQVEFRVTQPDGSVRWLHAQAELRPASNPGRLIGLVNDITDRKLREQQINFLMHEVNHRSKNLLSLILSIARQTAGSVNRDFVRLFTDRVTALSKNQDVLVEGNWRGVDMDALVRAQLSHLKGLLDRQIILQGATLRLSPAAAQTIAMALHELATNASKYGALSNDSGHVDIAWDITQPQDRDAVFSLSWRESGGPPVEKPVQRGFGSTVTVGMVQMGLDGTVTEHFAPTGFTWQVECPANNVIEPAEPT